MAYLRPVVHNSILCQHIKILIIAFGQSCSKWENKSLMCKSWFLCFAGSFILQLHLNSINVSFSSDHLETGETGERDVVQYDWPLLRFIPIPHKTVSEEWTPWGACNCSSWVMQIKGGTLGWGHLQDATIKHIPRLISRKKNYNSLLWRRKHWEINWHRQLLMSNFYEYNISSILSFSSQVLKVVIMWILPPFYLFWLNDSFYKWQIN